MQGLGSRTRILIGALILGSASAIALSAVPDSTNSAGGRDQSRSRVSLVETDGALESLRRKAALLPCPRSETGDRTAAGPLVGIVVPCLGEPRSVDLAAALQGEPVLLNVWASWCGVCRKEVPVLAEYLTRKQAIPVVGINVKDRSADALRLMIETGARYPSVVDVDGELRQALDAPPAVPLNYLLYPDGSVQRITEPTVFESADEVANAVRRYRAGDY